MSTWTEDITIHREGESETEHEIAVEVVFHVGARDRVTYSRDIEWGWIAAEERNVRLSYDEIDEVVTEAEEICRQTRGALEPDW